MHATLALLLAVSGLGCQNRSCDVVGAPGFAPFAACADTDQFSGDVGRPMHFTDASGAISPYYQLEEPAGFGDSMRDTFYSFFLGRSPGMPSAAEIEASAMRAYWGY
jgi:hypothetical protein